MKILTKINVILGTCFFVLGAIMILGYRGAGEFIEDLKLRIETENKIRSKK